MTTWEDYKNKNKETITKQVYSWLLDLNIVSNEEVFLEMLDINSTVGIHDKTKIFWGDYFTLFQETIDLTKFENKLQDSKINTQSSTTINKKLISIIETAELYLTQNKRSNDWSEKSFEQYDRTFIDKLINYYNFKKDVCDVCYNIRLLMDFAIHKTLPDDFYYGKNYTNDMHEFNNEVVKLYGVTSKPAIRAIISLSTREKPNIVALYELADMFYYGNQNGIKQDIPRAYSLYEKLAGIGSKSTDINDEVCHPLALWSIAYILLNYHRAAELKTCDSIPQIDQMDSENKLKRIELALRYADVARGFMTNEGPALNILGKIALLDEDEFPGITEIRTSYELKDADHYFAKAAEAGYVYSLNNLGLKEIDMIFSDPDHRNEHITKSFEYLSASASKYETWAGVELGEIYRTGTFTRRKNIIGPKTGEIYHSDTLVDNEKAIKYYKTAVEYMLDTNSAWAYYNLITYYPSIYQDNMDELKTALLKMQSIGNEKAFNKTMSTLTDTYKLSFTEIIGHNDEDH